MPETDPLFVMLEPPAGGVQRLRQRVHAAPTAPHRTTWRPLAAGALVVGLLGVMLLGPIQQQRSDVALALALRQAMTPKPLPDGIRIVNGAALELPGAQANARIYLVQSATLAAPVEQP